MPARLSVTFRTISGKQHTFRMSRAATCADLQREAQQRCGIPHTHVVICNNDTVLDEAAVLVELVEWFVLSDLLNPRASLVVELQLEMLLMPNPCAYCGSAARKCCGKCKKVR